MAKVNFNQLVQLHQEFRDRGLEILAFPCNQFMNQEPATNKEIAEQMRDRIGAEFPIFEKAEVNGKNPHEVFKYLRCNSSLWDQNKKRAKEIPWNFAKFLVSSDGKVLNYYNPRVNPIQIVTEIEAQLEGRPSMM